MSAKSPYENSADVSAGAIPEMCAYAGVVLLCAGLVTLALTAALLLLTLPGTLDAVAGSTPVIAVDASRTDECQPGQAMPTASTL